jgi:hypothetical protein
MPSPTARAWLGVLGSGCLARGAWLGVLGSGCSAGGEGRLDMRMGNKGHGDPQVSRLLAIGTILEASARRQSRLVPAAALATGARTGRATRRFRQRRFTRRFRRGASEEALARRRSNIFAGSTAPRAGVASVM